MAAAAREASSATVFVVPVLGDNYSYIIADWASRTAAVVDPVDPDKVKARADELSLSITTLLTTHSHWDHSSGNAKMKAMFPALEVYGGKGDNIPAVTREVSQGDEFSLGNTHIQVLYTPCHTPGHVCYLVTHPKDNEEQSLFTGDTLFVAGCGNFNDGSPQQMYDALLNKIAVLPPATKVYVGHEYTYKNLLFAQLVEPDNVDVRAKLAHVAECNKSGTPTVPSTIAEERATNPFLRVHEASVRAYAAKDDPVQVLAEIRLKKTLFGRGAL